ncbi:hypothetical protein C9F11_17825 [Streptomyces sp. YIM 121038]|nr:hypothetical protein C9F11_17825 [Streptomyces sp. YIM 121038]
MTVETKPDELELRRVHLASDSAPAFVAEAHARGGRPS